MTAGCDLFSLKLSDQLYWTHINGSLKGAAERLESLGMDAYGIDVLLDEITRPRLVEQDTSLLLILRGMNFNEGAQPEDMVSLRLYADENKIVSVEFRALKAVSAAKELIEQSRGPQTVGEYLVVLMQDLYERMEPTILKLSEELDDLEELVMMHPTTEERQAIIDIRKRAIVFRRYITPQRDLIGQLRNARFPWITDKIRRELQELNNHLTRYIEELDAIRERAQIVKDELVNSLSDKLNRNLYILSVITAIFLPMGFLTGLFGVNVGGMPGLESHEAFTILVVVMGLLLLIQILIFRRFRWF